MKKYFIGIDVSKEKLDFCVRKDKSILSEDVLQNSIAIIEKYLKRLMKQYCCFAQELILCAEYTGMYTYPLSCACEELNVDLWLENPSQIKFRSGIQRGKNDKLDARKIAAYVERFIDEVKLFTLPQKNIETLKYLVNERDLYMSDRKKYQSQLNDQKKFMDTENYKQKSKRLKSLVTELQKQIKDIESDIQKIIDNDETLSHQHELLMSVDGIGERVSIKIIVETNAFQDFKDPRKFCCHAGVAPFQYLSGSSQFSKNKVSQRADKSIKALLHMSALVVATNLRTGEMRDYYIRKVSEGKNKMSVLNAIRAKLVYRMFAVIRDNKFYEKDYVHSVA